MFNVPARDALKYALTVLVEEEAMYCEAAQQVLWDYDHGMSWKAIIYSAANYMQEKEFEAFLAAFC